MTADLRQAFTALRLDWALVPQDVWRPSTVHVDGVHPRATRAVELGIEDAIKSVDTSPIGVAIRGARGTGKTHLMGWIRERTQAAGGYFVLVGPLSGVSLWRAVASAFRRDLARPVGAQGTQLEIFLSRLAAAIGAKEATTEGMLGLAELTTDHLDDLVMALRRHDRGLASDCQDTLRALVLYNAPQRQLEDVGKSYLLSDPELEVGEQAAWGIRRSERTPNDIVSDITRLLAITGPTVVAFDQVDAISAEPVAGDPDTAPDSARRDALLDQVADGLLVLRNVTARTLTVLSCLPATWELLETNSLLPPIDRFRPPIDIGTIGSAELAAMMVSRRFAALLGRVGFDRPYPTFPIRREAFGRLANYTPRQLLQCIDEHVNACLESGDFREIIGIRDDNTLITAPITVADQTAAPAVDLEQELLAIDVTFDAACASASIEAALDGETENAAMPPLLAAGLAAWIQEQGDQASSYQLDPPPGARPDLHAKLTRVLDDETGAEITWSFRAIASAVPITALNRLRAACEEAAIEDGTGRRHLFVLREADWNQSPKTQEARRAFEAAGGKKVTPLPSDLRVFAGLKALLDEPPVFLQDWLLSRRPASKTTLLADALGPDDGVPAGLSDLPTKIPPQSRQTSTDRGAPRSAIVVGHDAEGQPTAISLESLRRHTVIFAGSGSGKTVLIRRLIEECALQGVSSIVLDPNNDLARLGEAWPEPPAEWSPADRRRADDYLRNTDVVIWTPRRPSGRPLTFQPLPDFTSVVNDPEELDAAIDSATAALTSRISLGTANRARVAEAVLREALRHHAVSGGSSDLSSYLDLLADLPPEVTDLDRDRKVSNGLAQALRAAVINDPLFGGRGEPVDPGLLLTPAAGKRARISVISLIGLTSDDQKQGFVNQLQMGLFGWMKQHPADKAPLGGLLIMDEAQNFAPSKGSTISKASTVALVAQARKYGFGLIFATQHPRGLDNHIPGNAATQFIGRLNAPVQIATAQDLARARGGDASDVGRLGVGEFYLTTETISFQLLRTPMCLSYHGRPLTEDEVISRAR